MCTCHSNEDVPIQENGIRRKRHNHQLYNLYNDVKISKKPKISRMKWPVHVLKMNDEPTKKLMVQEDVEDPSCDRLMGLEKISTTSVLETGKTSPLTIPDGGVILNRPRPTVGCSAHDDDKHNERWSDLTEI